MRGGNGLVHHYGHFLLTISVALYLRGPSAAVMVTVVVVFTARVVISSSTTLVPAGMVMLDGTLATRGLLLVRVIVGRPDAEMALSHTSRRELVPPVTGEKLTTIWPSVGTG
jgi:hypothetical protein